VSFERKARRRLAQRERRAVSRIWPYEPRGFKEDIGQLYLALSEDARRAYEDGTTSQEMLGYLVALKQQLEREGL
jgi:hypothetical protein